MASKPRSPYLTETVLPPDPKLLDYVEDSGMSEACAQTYTAYIECAKARGEDPTAADVARHMNEQWNDPGRYTGASVSQNIRTAQGRAMAAGWTPARGDLKVDPKVAQRNTRTVEKKLQNQVSTFVITWAQNATPVHTGFLSALQEYCKHRGATLLVVAGRYRNPTSIWSKGSRDQEYWAPEVAPYLIDRRIELNDNLTLMGDIKTQPTAETPLTGFDTITRDKSGIFGHPKVALKSVATPQNRFPKLLTTTGAITLRNYIDAKAGKKGEFHHTFGATVVEIQGGYFHMRQINACEDGSFIDLKHEYSHTGVKPAKRALGLVLGDIHTDFVDPQCEQAIFGKGGMLDFFKPRKVVLHDWYDGYSGSHHHRGRLFTQLAKHKSGRNDVRAEVMRTFERTKSWVRPGMDFYVVDSNHNQHLVRWLQETDPRQDLANFSFWTETCALMEPGVLMGDSGATYPNPLQLLADKYLQLDNLHFLSGSDRLMIDEVDCSYHGHEGPNGARGTIDAYATVGAKTVTGHGHSPGIKHGHYRVGTNSRMDLEYTGALSSWLHTDCVIYANGKRSLIHKLDGHWRAVRGRQL